MCVCMCMYLGSMCSIHTAVSTCSLLFCLVVGLCVCVCVCVCYKCLIYSLSPLYKLVMILRAKRKRGDTRSLLYCTVLSLLDSTCSRPNPSLIKLSFAETQVPYDLVVVGLLQKPSAARLAGTRALDPPLVRKDAARSPRVGQVSGYCGT